MKRILQVLIVFFAVMCFSINLTGGVGRAAEPIVLGVVTSLKFFAGDLSYKAVQLAVDEINAKGGVKVGSTRRPFKIVTADTRGAEPGVPVTEGLLALEKTILEKKVHAIVVGPFRSEVLLASMDIIAKHKVPMLGSIAMSPASEARIRENPEKYKYIFRLCLTSRYAGMYLSGLMAEINKEFGFNRVYLYVQDVMFARKSAEMMAGWFDKNGWAVLGQDIYPSGSTDFSTGLMKAKAERAQVLLTFFSMAEASILTKLWISMKIPALMTGQSTQFAYRGAWKHYDGKIAGCIDMALEVGSGTGAKKMPKSIAFYDAFVKRWGEYPPGPVGHGPAPSYEAVYVLAEAIERAGSLDPDAIVAEVEKTDRMGVMGRIRFDEGHQVPYGFDPKEAAMACVIQWTKDGQMVVIYPESIAEAKIQLPSGLKAIK
ncbi:MAG: ABC transporter substrate-binding protein [Deltaproteobacteria bacterium]|nr:MAG: ABC transporter substrate-binding protein [Deltaproteobacteria bacterium]